MKLLRTTATLIAEAFRVYFQEYDWQKTPFRQDSKTEWDLVKDQLVEKY